MYPVKYFKQVLLGKIFRPRTYVLLVLLGFVTYLYVKPVVAFSQEVHYKAAPWAFPFIVSNIYFIFLFMLGIVGEYIGRIYICMNQAPQYVIREMAGGAQCGQEE